MTTLPPTAPFELIPRSFYIAAEAKNTTELVLALSRMLQRKGWGTILDWSAPGFQVQKPYRDYPINTAISTRMLRAAMTSELCIFIAFGDPHGAKMEFGVARTMADIDERKRVVVIKTAKDRDSIFYCEATLGHVIILEDVRSFWRWYRNEYPS